VLSGRAREAADHRALDRLRDRGHRLRVAWRGDREAGLDDVDPQARELMRDLELFLHVERDSRRLLAIAQRRVEDEYAVGLLPVAAVLPRGAYVGHRPTSFSCLSPIPVALCGTCPAA